MVCIRLHLHSKFQPVRCRLGNLAVIKPISGCVHFVCSGLMATSLSMRVDCQDFLSTCFNESANIKLHQDFHRLDAA